jgi:hypothetical protein
VPHILLSIWLLLAVALEVLTQVLVLELVDIEAQ